MRDFNQKVVVITGAASGIGRSLAQGFAKRGANLALVDMNEAGLREVQEELSSENRKISIHIADVSERSRMEALPEEVLAAHGAVHVLVNNAGVSVGAMFDDHTIEDAEWLLGINLMGVIYGCKFFLPYLKTQDEAHIVNLSSMFGLFAMPGQALYSASKFAVRGFTESLWTELSKTSICLTTVHPGAIRTNVIHAARMYNSEAQKRAAALQEKYGMPSERAAEIIIRAVERNKLRVLVGLDSKIANFLKQIFPVGFQRLLTWAYRRSGMLE